MRIAFACLFFALAACGGGGGQSPSPPQTQPPNGIGAAGGTVSSGSAQVVIPAGALSQSTAIAIEQTEAGAPALPAGVEKFGPMFAFTPHGTTFAAPATVTLPFDPALVPAGTQVQFYKTDATQTSWQSIPVTSTGATSVTADVTGFSHMVAGGTPPALTREQADRAWVFEKILAESDKVVAAEDRDHANDNTKLGGVVEDEHDYGPLPFNFNGDTTATGAVFSSETGGTYWVFAQGPKGDVKTPASTIGNRVSLTQKQGFKKNRTDARLKLHVTKVYIEAIDANGQEILYPECPTSLECGLTITGIVNFDVKVYRPFITPFFSGASRVQLSGYQGKWAGRNRVVVDGRQQLWGDVFEIDRDAGGFGSQQHAIYQLKEPVTIDIDISQLDVGVPFILWAEVVAETNNHRQRESYVAAFFRDPISIEGAEIETFGLDPVAGPFADPVPDEPEAPECSSGDEAAAGTLQFAAATFLAPEIAQAFTQVEITRTGGTLGAVSARVRTHDDTAHAGEDYETVSKSVYFGPGDDTPRVLEVPLTLDDVAEPDKSLTLTLSDPRGCATLGTQASATLTILDDDRPEPPPPPSGLDETFGSQGKTALAGFGDETGMAIAPDGKIVMVGGKFIDFVLARFNADGTVDTDFGVDGKVTTDLAGGFAQERARAVAIQPDGKIVVAGEAAMASGDLAVALVRYNADGTLDTTFGTGGKVFGSMVGRAFDVAVLPDGRIVIAGDSPVANNPNDFGDFLLARFQANGLLDTTFGTLGSVVHDMSSRTDLARNIVVQPNGALVVSGDPFGSDPARRTSVARYDADGHLDATFAGGGKLVLAGAYVGRGLALQNDGRLVLVGTVPVLNVQNDFTHFAVMRLNADGTFDDSFGDSGMTSTSITGLTDVAHAVVVQADGKIVVAGEGNLINPNFAVVRYDRNGDLDTSFAVNGKLVVDFAGLEDRAENVGLQSDGKIIAGGLETGRAAGYGVIRVHQ
ncbi:MAG TPA: Calx-beta domain-containing protein [Steroidobacteraceae bacterium]|nr:Calx-beta domain-containing protein [Steroidobacteraceae bacterium]